MSKVKMPEVFVFEHRHPHDMRYTFEYVQEMQHAAAEAMKKACDQACDEVIRRMGYGDVIGEVKKAIRALEIEHE